jgi:hypothetical protein
VLSDELLILYHARQTNVGIVGFMVFSSTFSYIMAVIFIVGRNRSNQRKPPTCRKSLTSFITSCCIEYTSPLTGFKLTTLVVIGTDCTGICKSNYHTITTTTAALNICYNAEVENMSN